VVLIKQSVIPPPKGAKTDFSRRDQRGTGSVATARFLREGAFLPLLPLLPFCAKMFSLLSSFPLNVILQP
jgi:hypothetical protein